MTRDSWWVSEYPALIEAVEQASENTLSTSYITGTDGSGKVELFLLKKENNGLVLKMKLPRQAVRSVDPQTGLEIPSVTTPVVIIRDHDLDGLPDDFRIEPSGEPLYKEEFSEDGFTIYRNHPEHQIILAQWAIGIGYCINHFAHGVNSPMPR